MSIKKLALFSTATLFCAGLAFAQPPAADAQHPDHNRPDFTAMHKNMCEDHEAHTAAKLAFVEAKLSLTDAQKPLFAKWRQAVLDSANKQKASCLAEAPQKPEAKPTVLDREQKEEQMLQAKLQILQATRPTLQAFYNSLTDAQKDSFNRMHEEHMGGHEGFGHGGPDGGDHEGPGSMHRPQ